MYGLVGTTCPITLALTVVTLTYLLAVKPKGRSMNGTRDYFKDLYSKLPPMDKAELISLALFVVATILALPDKYMLTCYQI